MAKIQADFNNCKMSFEPEVVDAGSTADDVSGSTVVITEKLVLETEEKLLRLLERLDGIQCGAMANDLKSLQGSKQQLEKLEHGLEGLVVMKKALVERIQTFFKQLDDRIHKS